ncbi:hypothetical protein L9W73_18225 [Vibrio aestuarianus]|uniref:Uncharacterized protein n=1 Tax=Vibrio aestuarianus TaxID=28171 RepID=A0A9X4FQ51_9VIBR|nr:hypothetical protein [Vibrio aestuarianus]MDE1359206.1 hypothetical protein [Vibrio aestuarianus]
MKKFEDVIKAWKESLVHKVELGSLYSKSPVAHKWKCTYRSLVIRELTFWRVTDLIEQAYLLHKNRHALGYTPHDPTGRFSVRSSKEEVS